MDDGKEAEFYQQAHRTIDFLDERRFENVKSAIAMHIIYYVSTGGPDHLIRPPVDSKLTLTNSGVQIINI